jgi:FtsP/CotA-like multicopper oxidase with cupredoxin domain
MKKLNLRTRSRTAGIWTCLILLTSLWASTALAYGPLTLPGNPNPGQDLDPTTIPKYVQPLVIPPVMPTATVQPLGKDANGVLDPNVVVPSAKYNIAMRQFRQQILPGGAWNTVTGRNDAFPATPVWSYGPAEVDPVAVFNATSPLPLAQYPTAYFNYPAFTLEETSNLANTVRWINDLKNPLTGNFLPHLLTGTVDQTLHWANPTNTGCTNPNQVPQTDCATYNAGAYNGPVPIVTHVHGAHVNAESDGYPEAWWLADANNIDPSFRKQGTLFTQNINGLAQGPQLTGGPMPTDLDPVDGAAFYTYENTQPATTIWYHDHALGMTRLNVYAGPAGFYLIRGGANDGGVDLMTGAAAVLPGPAPVAGEDPNFVAADRAKLREIPIVIQDRTFNADGTLFYPSSRAFFDGFTGPYAGDVTPPATQASDIAPIWNPEAFFNTMVVNGTTWPKLDVAPAKYRFRLLNGSNSRFLNLALFTVDPATGATTAIELPFYQIGADQGFLPTPVEISTGFLTPVNLNNAAKVAAEFQKQMTELNASIAKLQAKLAGITNAKKIAEINKEIAKIQATILTKTTSYYARLAQRAVGAKLPGPDPAQALLMAPAERADVIVDFSGLAAGTIVRMINTGDDAPFGGFPNAPADPLTTGQVMQFVVNQPTLASDATTVSPFAFVPNAEVYNPAAPNALTGAATTVIQTPRALSLNEESSQQVCVGVDLAGNITGVLRTYPPHTANIAALCADPNLGPVGVPMAPKAAVLGLITTDPTTGVLAGIPHMWKDAITENPVLDTSEFWDFYNLTVDGHPIHMHLVRYKVIQRQLLDPVTLQPAGVVTPALPTEAGMKDTVLSYPGEVTRVQATFNLPGLYVWHCHIVEHEDNEMMRPFYVGALADPNFPVPMDPTNAPLVP